MVKRTGSKLTDNVGEGRKGEKWGVSNKKNRDERKNLTVEITLQCNILESGRQAEYTVVGRISKCCVVNLNFIKKKPTTSDY